MLVVNYVNVADIKNYERNARTHSADQVKQIAESIRQFGFTNPVLLDPDGVLIAGHGRLQAAKLIGLDNVPAITLQGLTPAQVKALRLADNRIAMNSGWDSGMLKAELEDLKALDFSISELGFTASEISNTLFPKAENQDDDFEAGTNPADAEAVSKPGDVWVLGDHRLACGDSTDAVTVALALDGAKPNLMVTDPPYGVEYDPEWRNRAGINKNKGKSGEVKNDDKADWRAAWALFPGDVAYVWHAGLFASTVQQSLEACGFKVRSQIVWSKDRFALSRGNYHWQHEPCWYVVKKGGKGHWHGDRKQSTVWNIKSRDDAGVGHGTQKPVECMRRPMENNSVPGNAVYEPFSGSGTTIIAGEQSGRRVLAIELNPLYIDVAVKRWQEFTGRQATLQGADKTWEDVANDRYDFRKDGFASYELWCAEKNKELVNARQETAA